MKKKKKVISRRSFLKAASTVGISAVSTTPFSEAHASPLRTPSAEYGREKAVPVLCRMCAQFCPANAYVKDGKVIRLEASPVHEYHGICGRSRAAVGALYNADRITTPLVPDWKANAGVDFKFANGLRYRVQYNYVGGQYFGTDYGNDYDEMDSHNTVEVVRVDGDVLDGPFTVQVRARSVSLTAVPEENNDDPTQDFALYIFNAVLSD